MDDLNLDENHFVSDMIHNLVMFVYKELQIILGLQLVLVTVYNKCY